jgi:hypothetical protein
MVAYSRPLTGILSEYFCRIRSASALRFSVIVEEGMFVYGEWMMRAGMVDAISEW